MSLSKQQVGSIAVMLIIAVVIAIFSYNTVWLGDDIRYAYSFVDGLHNYRIHDFPDVVASQLTHYQRVNGRIVAHCIIQMFCGPWGHLPFAIANGIVYALFIYGLCKVCGSSLGNTRSVLSISIMCLLSFMTKMVPSCQICYIWMFTLVLFWLYIFFHKAKANPSWWIYVAVGIFSILAGNGQEGLSIGICGAGLIYWWQNRKDFSPMQYVMAIGFGIGTLVNCLAPATFNRVENGSSSLLFKAFSAMNFFIYGRAVLIMLIVVCYRMIRYKINWLKIYWTNSFWWNSLVILILFNATLGFPSNRAMFGIELISVILLFKNLPKIQFTTLWLVIATVICVIIYSLQGEMIFRHKAFHEQVVRDYAESKDGIIYADFNNRSYLPEFNKFIAGYKAYVNGCIGDAEHDLLAQELKYRHPEKKEIIVLPSVLKQDSQSSRLILLTPGYWLCVKSDRDDADFSIYRSIDIGPLSKRIPPIAVDFSTPMFASDMFKAAIIVDEEYKISELCTIDVR